MIASRLLRIVNFTIYAVLPKMFSDPDMMRQVMETVGTVLYERLRGQRNEEETMR